MSTDRSHRFFVSLRQAGRIISYEALLETKRAAKRRAANSLSPSSKKLKGSLSDDGSDSEGGLRMADRTDLIASWFEKHGGGVAKMDADNKQQEGEDCIGNSSEDDSLSDTHQNRNEYDMDDDFIDDEDQILYEDSIDPGVDLFQAFFHQERESSRSRSPEKKSKKKKKGKKKKTKEPNESKQNSKDKAKDKKQEKGTASKKKPPKLDQIEDIKFEFPNELTKAIEVLLSEESISAHQKRIPIELTPFFFKVATLSEQLNITGRRAVLQRLVKRIKARQEGAGHKPWSQSTIKARMRYSADLERLKTLPPLREAALERLRMKVNEDSKSFEQNVVSGKGANVITSKKDKVCKYKTRWDMFAPDLLKVMSISEEYTKAHNFVLRHAPKRHPGEEKKDWDSDKRDLLKKIHAFWPQKLHQFIKLAHITNAWKRYMEKEKDRKNEAKANAKSNKTLNKKTPSATSIPESKDDTQDNKATKSGNKGNKGAQGATKRTATIAGRPLLGSEFAALPHDAWNDTYFPNMETVEPTNP